MVKVKVIVKNSRMVGQHVRVENIESKSELGIHLGLEIVLYEV